MARRSLAAQIVSGTGRLAKELLAANAVPSRLQPFARALSAFGGYEAAKPSRLRKEWPTQSSGPNATVAEASTSLVARSRDLERNDAHWNRFLDLLCIDVVGTGIVPRAVHPSGSGVDADGKPKKRTRLQKQADAVWEWLCQRGVADVEGRLTLYAMTYVACRAWGRDGSVFVRAVWDLDPTRLVPLRFQVMERDMLDTSITRTTATGGQVIGGIQLAATGRVEGYWFRKSHPGESGLFYDGAQSVFVPVEDCAHLYIPSRPGQLDGIPFGASSMVRKRDLGSYENAELTRKETEAMNVAIVTPPAIAEAIGDLEIDSATGQQYGLTPTVVNERGEAVGDMGPGAVLTVENGGSVSYNQPHVVAFYPEYKKAMIREVAIGWSATYEDASGDLEGVNYTSYRAGHIKRHAYADGLIWLWFIPTLMDFVYGRAMAAAYLRGNVSQPIVPHEWSPPIRVSVDPDKDTAADVGEERAGYALHDDNLAKRGINPAVYYERRKAELAAMDESGGKYDTDPRNYGYRGATPALAKGDGAPSTEPAPKPQDSSP